MVKSHLLSRSTLSSAIIGVVPKEASKRDGGEDDSKTSMHEVGTAGKSLNIKQEIRFQRPDNKKLLF